MSETTQVGAVEGGKQTAETLQTTLNGLAENAALTAKYQAEFQMKMADINMEKGAVSALASAMRTTSQQLAQSA